MVLLSHVLLKVLCPFETLPAYLAAKRSLFRVSRKVTLQLVLTGTLASAHFTDVLVLCSPKEDVTSCGNVKVGRVELGKGRLNIWT